MGFSAGCFDGVPGSQTRAALRAFQMSRKLAPSGDLESETRARLSLLDPPMIDYSVTTEDLARLLAVGRTWLEKSEQPRLDYETLLELVSEKAHSHSNFVYRLNPSANWTNPVAGMTLKIPNPQVPDPNARAAFLRIQLGNKTVQALDASTNIIAHFPCSIARKVEKRPIGELRVAKLAHHPNYVFDPEMFPESSEARLLKKRLVLPAGPNNPVGMAWIGLDKPGYGIHGSPRPEQIGHSESHGCFRLTNWDAEYLLKIVWVGMPVWVEP